VVKWLVRITAGVLIAVLGLTMFRVGGYARGNLIAVAAILYFVGRCEGFDMSSIWGDDDDDDSQGPLRPT
jgi:hypothetical protein